MADTNNYTGPGFWQMFGPTAALGGLGAIMRGLAGDPYAEIRKTGFRAAKGLMGEPVINVDRAAAGIDQRMVPFINDKAEGLNKRFGFDSGRAQGALMDEWMRRRSGMLSDLYTQNDILTGNRRASLAQAMMMAG